jgi:hypothetical protein
MSLHEKVAMFADMDEGKPIVVVRATLSGRFETGEGMIVRCPNEVSQTTAGPFSGISVHEDQ